MAVAAKLALPKNKFWMRTAGMGLVICKQAKEEAGQSGRKCQPRQGSFSYKRSPLPHLLSSLRAERRDHFTQQSPARFSQRRFLLRVGASKQKAAGVKQAPDV